MADKETRLAAIQLLVDQHRKDYSSVEELNDGYHSFKELYDHRIWLWIKLLTYMKLADMGLSTESEYWRTKAHSDGSVWEGWFILGFSEMGNQITYHLPMERWDDCGFADILEKAPEWDGHTSADVLERLKTL